MPGSQEIQAARAIVSTTFDAAAHHADISRVLELSRPGASYNTPLACGSSGLAGSIEMNDITTIQANVGAAKMARSLELEELERSLVNAIKGIRQVSLPSSLLVLAIAELWHRGRRHPV